MKDEHEEGIGTSISVVHHSPAFPGEEVIFESRLKEIKYHEIITTYEAWVDGRLIASGDQVQKIFEKRKLERILASTRSERKKG
jgi:predicted thioesterase